MEGRVALESGKLHVLLVDEDAAAIELASSALSSAGHRVSLRSSTVGTAADVIDLHPDVVLLEVIMPGLRGDDLARLLKRHPATSGTAVILYSAIPLAELRTMIMLTGALGVIEKRKNQVLFLQSFNTLTAKLRASSRSQDGPNSGAMPAASGTFAIESKQAPAQVSLGGKPR